MVFVVLLALLVLIVLVARRNQGAQRNILLRSGTPARGIVLQANSLATETAYAGQRFECRGLVLDVEVPGEEPYEISIAPMIPRICEALPGATLELRVDKSNRKKIAIVGPLGSSDWLGAAATLSGQAWAGPPLSGRLAKGCSTAVVVIVGMLLLVGALASLFASGKEASTTHPPSVKGAPRPVVTHLPAKANSHAK